MNVWINGAILCFFSQIFEAFKCKVNCLSKCPSRPFCDLSGRFGNIYWSVSTFMNLKFRFVYLLDKRQYICQNYSHVCQEQCIIWLDRVLKFILEMFGNTKIIKSLYSNSPKSLLPVVIFYPNCRQVMLNLASVHGCYFSHLP